jgi:hypothetical protein
MKEPMHFVMHVTLPVGVGTHDTPHFAIDVDPPRIDGFTHAITQQQVM